MSKLNLGLCCVFYLLTASLTAAQNQTIDSLKRILQSGDLEGTERVVALQHISAEYWSMNMDTAILYAGEVLALAEEIGYERGKANAYILLGACYNLLGNFPSALNYMHQALALYEDLEDPAGIAVAFENIGLLFSEQGQYEKALVNFENCLAIKISMKDTYGQGDIYHSMGTLYFRMGDYTRSLSTLTASLEIWNQLEEYPKISATEISLGDTYLAQGALVQAESLYSDALQISQSLGNKGIMAKAHLGLAKCSLEQGDLTKAHAQAESSYALQTEVGDYIQLVENFQVLMEIEKAAGNKAKAFEYAELLIEAKDSLFSEEKAKAIGDLEAQRRFDQLENQRALAQQLEQSQQRLFKAVAISLVFALIILCIIGFRGYRNKSRANIQISQKNREIQDQNEELQALHLVKDKVFSIIAHDLRSPINSLEALLALVSGTQGKVSEKELAGIFGRISKSVHGVSGLLNNLLYWGRTQMEGGTQLKPGTLSLSTHITEATQVLDEIAKGKNIEIHLDLEEEAAWVWADPEVLRLLIRNLLNNAFKFSHPGGKVEVQTATEGEQVKVSVIDYGVGMDPTTQSSLFRGYVDSQRGTGSEKGTGLGLMLCYDFSAKSGGSMGVESELGKGSHFWFTLPAKAVI
ncbi:MAG: tetratricopeptide repeat protein [Bacteroidota bacterium]